MSPEERIQEMVSEQLSRHERNQQQLTSQLLDQSDRSGFDARCATNPLFKKLAPKVEAELSSLRAKGQNLSREAIATYLIGQRVIEQQGSGRAPARQRRQQQNSRPVNSRGDGNRDRGQRRAGATDIVSDAESRFGDVPI